MYPYIIICACFLAGGFGIFVLTKRYYQSQTEKMYQNLLQILDQSLHGNMMHIAMRNDESMESSVIARLNRLVQITKRHQQNAEKERDTVKAFLSDISHQVRTPLTNMMLYTGLLKEQPLCTDALRLVDKLQKQSDKLDFFMKELVKSSYAEQEMIAIHPKRICVQEMIQTACQIVELAAMKKGIVIAADRKAAGELSCYADKKWTVEAVANVLENAVKYSPESSVIDVTVVSYEIFVCIQIQDCGIGIREEEQGLVFDRFYRSKEVKDIAGYGIGLYLVREVLSKQGGYAKIQSEYGKGTMVRLYLLRSGEVPNVLS